MHAGSNDGSVQNACKVSQTKKNTVDYHGESYENWFKRKLHLNIHLNSVIVIDNAPYHSV